MFNIENKEYSVIKISITGTITLDELKKILGVLTRVFQTKKNFAFYVHCNFTETPTDLSVLSKYLLNWMKESNEDIKNYLQCSSLIIKSGTLVNVFNGVFKICKPTKPNYITTDYKLGEEFVTQKMKEFLKKSKP